MINNGFLVAPNAAPWVVCFLAIVDMLRQRQTDMDEEGCGAFFAAAEFGGER